jgi:ferrous iron transport protein B
LAVIISRLFKRFLFPKDETPFVMELPPYRVPTAKSMFTHTWEKGGQYLKKMGTVILIGSIIIWFLGYYPRPENMGKLTPVEHMKQQENSYIGQIGHALEPVIAPLGFDWKIGVSLLSGVAAKEIVVSTLSVLYTGKGNSSDQPLSVRLGTEVRANGDPGFTPAVALALMVFVLIYFPCLATFVAIKNETGKWGWAVFASSYSLVLAWVMAFAVFQIFR